MIIVQAKNRQILLHYAGWFNLIKGKFKDTIKEMPIMVVAIFNKISLALTTEFGKGWSEQQLRHCLRFVEAFPDKEIVYALRIQLTRKIHRKTIDVDIKHY